METTLNIHLGSLVKQELLKQEKSVFWLSEAIKVERSGIYKLFRRKNISMQLLLKISIALNHDFFEDISEALKNSKLESESIESSDSEDLLE